MQEISSGQRLSENIHLLFLSIDILKFNLLRFQPNLSSISFLVCVQFTSVLVVNVIVEEGF